MRISPSRMWHTIGLGIGGPAVFDPGCMMMSRIETVLNPGINDGLSPYLRITTPGQGLVSFPVRASVVCAAASRTNPAEAAAKPIFNADLRSIPFIDVLPDPIRPCCRIIVPNGHVAQGACPFPDRVSRQSPVTGRFRN